MKNSEKINILFPENSILIYFQTQVDPVLGVTEMIARYRVEARHKILQGQIESGKFDLIEWSRKKTKERVENRIIEDAMKIIERARKKQTVQLTPEHKRILFNRFVPEDVVLVHPATYGEMMRNRL